MTKIVEQMMAFCGGAFLGVLIGSICMSMIDVEQMESIKADARESVEYWRSEFFKLQEISR